MLLFFPVENALNQKMGKYHVPKIHCGLTFKDKLSSFKWTYGSDNFDGSLTFILSGHKY